MSEQVLLKYCFRYEEGKMNKEKNVNEINEILQSQYVKKK